MFPEFGGGQLGVSVLIIIFSVPFISEECGLVRDLGKIVMEVTCGVFRFVCRGDDVF